MSKHTFKAKDFCDTCSGDIVGTIAYTIIGGEIIITNQIIEADNESKNPCKCIRVDNKSSKQKYKINMFHTSLSRAQQSKLFKDGVSDVECVITDKVGHNEVEVKFDNGVTKIILRNILIKV